MNLQPPIMSPSSGSSFIDFAAVTLVIIGVLVAIFAIPAFRNKTSEHFKDLSTSVNGKEVIVTSTTSEPTDIAVGVQQRKEIDNFDLDIFKEK